MLREASPRTTRSAPAVICRTWSSRPDVGITAGPLGSVGGRASSEPAQRCRPPTGEPGTWTGTGPGIARRRRRRRPSSGATGKRHRPPGPPCSRMAPAAPRRRLVEERPHARRPSGRPGDLAVVPGGLPAAGTSESTRPLQDEVGGSRRQGARQANLVVVAGARRLPVAEPGRWSAWGLQGCRPRRVAGPTWSRTADRLRWRPRRSLQLGTGARRRRRRRCRRIAAQSRPIRDHGPGSPWARPGPRRPGLVGGLVPGHGRRSTPRSTGMAWARVPQRLFPRMTTIPVHRPSRRPQVPASSDDRLLAQCSRALARLGPPGPVGSEPARCSSSASRPRDPGRSRPRPRRDRAAARGQGTPSGQSSWPRSPSCPTGTLVALGATGRRQTPGPRAERRTRDDHHPVPAEHLRGRGGRVHLPGDPGTTSRAHTWNLAVDQRPPRSP